MKYFSTLCAITFLVYLHLLFFLSLFNFDKVVEPDKLGEKWKYYIPVLVLALPIFLFLKKSFKEEDLKELSYSTDKIRKGNIILIIDFITIFALLIINSEIRNR